MFEKRKDAPQEAQTSPKPQEYNEPAPAPATKGKTAVIGPGIRINGDISGDENLIIEGTVDGAISLSDHQVDVGPSGKVTADVTGRVIKISGEVKGDINGGEKVVISRSGKVRGNIVSPRVTLEDGALFKGSIDMDPGEPKRTASQPTKSTSTASASANSGASTNGQSAPAEKKSSGAEKETKEAGLGL